MNETIRLRDACETVIDCPHSTPLWTDFGKIVLRSQNIRNGRLDLSTKSYTDTEHFADRIRRTQPQEGDLVITREAPMGEVCQIPPGLECCLGQRMVLLRPNEARYHGKFMLYAIQSPAVQHEILINEGTGSTVSNLRIPLLENLTLPFPPLPTQKAIAHILGTLDDKIELLRSMNGTLEAMARAIFKSWFIDFDPVRKKAEGQPTGLPPEIDALFPDSFEDSELGEIPKGWEVQNLTKTLDVVYGENISTSELSGNLFPVYGGNGVIGFLDRYCYKEPQVLIACRGAASGKVVITVPESSVTHNSLVLKVPTSSYLTHPYLRQYCLMQDYSTYVTGSAQPQLTIQNLHTAKILIPSPAAIKSFSDITLSPLREIRAFEKEQERLKLIRDSLLPKLISGEIELSEKDISKIMEPAK